MAASASTSVGRCRSTYWRRRRTHVAFPPYWFFTNDSGRQVLERRIAPSRSIGVHVPTNVPSRADRRAPELQGHELFTVPGEVRDIREHRSRPAQLRRADERRYRGGEGRGAERAATGPGGAGSHAGGR